MTLASRALAALSGMTLLLALACGGDDSSDKPADAGDKDAGERAEGGAGGHAGGHAAADSGSESGGTGGASADSGSPVDAATSSHCGNGIVARR